MPGRPELTFPMELLGCWNWFWRSRIVWEEFVMPPLVWVGDVLPLCDDCIVGEVVSATCHGFVRAGHVSASEEAVRAPEPLGFSVYASFESPI